MRPQNALKKRAMASRTGVGQPKILALPVDMKKKVNKSPAFANRKLTKMEDTRKIDDLPKGNGIKSENN